MDINAYLEAWLVAGFVLQALHVSLVVLPKCPVFFLGSLVAIVDRSLVVGTRVLA